MRNRLLSAAAVAVAALGLLLLPGQSFARGGHGGGHGGHGGGHGGHAWGGHGGGGHYYGGHNRGYYGHHGGYYGHHHRFYGGYGYPFLYGGYYYPYNYSYYSAPYYDTTVDQVYPPTYYPSSYSQSVGTDVAPAGNVASVTVYSPAPNAEIWFNGKPVTVQGSSQTFSTPPLTPGQDYHYRVRARWTENGQTVVRDQNVPVHAGEQVVVDFQNTAVSR